MPLNRFTRSPYPQASHPPEDSVRARMGYGWGRQMGDPRRTYSFPCANVHPRDVVVSGCEGMALVSTHRRDDRDQKGGPGRDSKGNQGMVPVTMHRRDRDQKGGPRDEEWLEGGGERNWDRGPSSNAPGPIRTKIERQAGSGHTRVKAEKTNTRTRRSQGGGAVCHLSRVHPKSAPCTLQDRQPISRRPELLCSTSVCVRSTQPERSTFRHLYYGQEAGFFSSGFTGLKTTLSFVFFLVSW